MKKPSPTANKEIFPYISDFQRSSIHASTFLGLGHNPVNFPMRVVSARRRASLQGSSGDSSREGISSIFLTNLDEREGLYLGPAEWTNTLNASNRSFPLSAIRSRAIIVGRHPPANKKTSLSGEPRPLHQYACKNAGELRPCGNALKMSIRASVCGEP
jgi:hypothetical protein